MYRFFLTLAIMLPLSVQCFSAEADIRKVLIRDVTTVEGVRENPLLGYGMVVGLNGTGDRRQTAFSTQTLANILQRMGVQIPAGSARVNNVAAVFVTANLPAFARPGMNLDVTVSSVGDAKSLEGGLLLLTPLHGADGQIYGAAQGPVAVGGYSAAVAGNLRQLNHPTVGRIPGGGVVERDTALDLGKLQPLSLLLSEPNFSTAEEIAGSINREFGAQVALADDSRRVEISSAAAHIASLPAFLARVENLSVLVHRRAKVVINERTGTVVMGKDVRLGAVAIPARQLFHRNHDGFSVSQPAPFSRGETALVPQPNVRTEETPARRIELGEGAKVEQLVNGLQAIGATARDVIAILQAIKAAGALEADLEVI